MGMFRNLFDASKKKTQRESGCCSLELEEISDEEMKAEPEKAANSNGGCCGGTAREDAPRVEACA